MWTPMRFHAVTFAPVHPVLHEAAAGRRFRRGVAGREGLIRRVAAPFRLEELRTNGFGGFTSAPSTCAQIIGNWVTSQHTRIKEFPEFTAEHRPLDPDKAQPRNPVI